MSEAALRLEGVSKVFHEGRPNEVLALEGIDLELAGGALTVLRGPSGSGKSTLLSLLGCLARPTTGRIHRGERLLSGLPERFLTRVRRETFGFVFQRFHLVRGLSALENVALPAVPTGRPRAEVRARARELLAERDLAEKADQLVENLSGGEAQRVALARALINDPAVILADEPTANLGREHSGPVLDGLVALRDAGRTVVLTSHDPAVWEHPAVDEVVHLEDGRLVGGGP